MGDGHPEDPISSTSLTGPSRATALVSVAVPVATSYYPTLRVCLKLDLYERGCSSGEQLERVGVEGGADLAEMGVTFCRLLDHFNSD